MWNQCRGIARYGLIAVFTFQTVVFLGYFMPKNYPKFKQQRRVLFTQFNYSSQVPNIMGENRQTLDDLGFDAASSWTPTGVSNRELYPFVKKSFMLTSGRTEDFFQTIGHTTCLKYGTYDRNQKGQCLCKPGWYGSHCSIPESVQSSETYNVSHSHTKVSLNPRRIMNAFTFNREWSMLETRMNELGSLVDIFIILESNYTLYGDPKQLNLLKRLQSGYLKEFHHKIMHVCLDHFPKGGREDGWLAEKYSRNYLFKEGVQKVKGALPRDLFMYNDADEVPSFESVLFLKLHEGYSEPVGFLLNWACFGFFCTQNKLFTTTSVCSLDFFEEIAGNKVQNLRGQKYKDKGTERKAWHIGSKKSKGGWHCSWCLPVKDIQNKLVSAINADFPRWGDYPEKRKLSYIRHIVKTCTWFDDKRMGIWNVTYKSEPSIVPRYFVDNAEHFRYLLDVKYAGLENGN